jgi:hypothetical protein
MEQKKLLKEILGRAYVSNEEILFYCPYCKHHKKKLSVNIEKNVFKCWICDTTGMNIRRIIKRFGSYEQLKRWDKVSGQEDISKFDDIFDKKYIPDVKQKTSLPAEFVTLTGKDIPLSAQKPLNFLKNRGVTREDIIRWKLGYCVRGTYSDRIIVPSFDLEGYVNYFVARTYNGDWRKYLNPSLSKNIIFNHLYIDWDSDIILVEGVFDAIVAGPNAIPLLGSTLREESKLFQEIVKNDASVFLALDKDAEEKSKKIISKLILYDVETYAIDTSGFEDVGEMTKDEFKLRKENATNVATENYLLYKKMGF